MISQQMKVFLAVAEYGSFSKAADKLFITPAAVMKHINSLENRLDITLFKRTNQGCSLTRAGGLMYKEGYELVQSADNILKKAIVAASAEAKTLRVGSSFLNPSNALTDLWEQFHSHYPEYKFTIIPYTDDNVQVVSTIKELGVKYDFIVGTLINSTRVRRFANYLELGAYDLCVAVSQRHPLANKDKLTYFDLYDKHIMMVNSEDTVPMTEFYETLKSIHPRITLDFVGYHYDVNTFNICEQTNSILLTLNAWKNIHPSLVTVPVEWDFKVPYGILYAKEPSETVASFVRILENMLH